MLTIINARCRKIWYSGIYLSLAIGSSASWVRHGLCMARIMSRVFFEVIFFSLEGIFFNCTTVGRRLTVLSSVFGRAVLDFVLFQSGH